MLDISKVVEDLTAERDRLNRAIEALTSAAVLAMGGMDRQVDGLKERQTPEPVTLVDLAMAKRKHKRKRHGRPVKSVEAVAPTQKKKPYTKRSTYWNQFNKKKKK